MSLIRGNTQILNKSISNDRFMDQRWKHPVRLLETVLNIGLSNGATVDGLAVSTGDRVALFAQTTTSQNGIYLVDTGGAWTRVYDFEVGDDVAATVFSVEEGNTHENQQWTIANNTGNAIVATNNLTIYQSGGSGSVTADNGLTENSGVIELGGTLIKNTIVDAASFDFELQRTTTSGIGGVTSLDTDNDKLELRYTGSGSPGAMVGVDASNGYAYLQGFNISTGNSQFLRSDATETIFGAELGGGGTQTTWEGVKYDYDYSTNFVDDSLITKRYVDNLINGRQWKSPVRAIVDGTNVTGNVTLSNGQTIDGVVLATGDRVGVFNQTTSSEDGVYVVDTAGAWARANDWSLGYTAANFTFFSKEGTLNSDCEFTVTNNSSSDVIGTNDLILEQTAGQSAISAGDGLVRNSNDFDVVAADLSLLVNADDMQVNIGTTNGTSLEVSATGLELVSAVTGARTFSHTNTEFGITANNLTFYDTEISDGAVTTAIPFSMTPTIDYGNGNTTISGGAIDQFRADFTDDAIINALIQLKAQIDTTPTETINSSTTLNITNQTAICSVAPTTGVSQLKVYLNGNRVLPTTEYVITTASTGLITFTAAQVIVAGDVVTYDYIDA